MLLKSAFKNELEQLRLEYNTGKLPFANGVHDMSSRQLMVYTECT